MKRTSAPGPAHRPFASLCTLACTLLLGLLLLAAAQEEVPLRLVHEGAPLPSGTAVVLLKAPGEAGPTGNIQPEFYDVAEYPRETSRVAGRDTLGSQGRTTQAYPPTQSEGELYFLYAKAPNGTLYSSYSVERAMLKYDVVETGAMSVAPISDADRRAEIAALFFESDAPSRANDGAAERPGNAAEAIEGAALGMTSPQETQEDTLGGEGAVQEEDASEAASPNTLTLGLGVLALLFLLTTLFLLVRYRQLRAAHEDLMATHRAATAARMTPERIRQLENELATVTRKYETVRQSCETLLARYDRLLNQLEDARRVTKKSE